MTKQVTLMGEVLPAQRRQSNVFIAKKSSGGLTPPPGYNGKTVQNRSYDFEDEFSGLYDVGQNKEGIVLFPPYLPRTLESLVQQNNTLSVCIDAVVTNVHGSGYDIQLKNPTEEEDLETLEDDGFVKDDEVIEDEPVPAQKFYNGNEGLEPDTSSQLEPTAEVFDEKPEKAAEDPAKAAIEAFFESVTPDGESFLSLRRKLGEDVEKVGYFYIEVLRRMTGEIVFLRRLDPKIMRLVKLDDPIPVPVKVTRMGQEEEAIVPIRFRRFAQQLGGANVRYFKQYGCPRRLNAKTGEWVSDGAEQQLDEIATEVIYHAPTEDSLTPYGIPKWAPQIPSVLLSRQAEEFNLQFFDAGGVPPAMIFVHGGELSAAAAEALRDHVQGGRRTKHNIPVIEAISTSGSMDSAGSVRVTVERFGSERQGDAMFEKLDDKCEKRIRRAWRLPPLFVGATDDYNFASAQASYMVAEAQVFAPARAAFDELINRTIMRELDPEGKYEFRSRPINVRDVETQLAAIESAISNGLIGRKQIIEILNEVSNLSLRLDEDDLPNQGPTSSPLDPDTGMPLDPETGLPIDPGAQDAAFNGEDSAARFTQKGRPLARRAAIIRKGKGGKACGPGKKKRQMAMAYKASPEDLADTAFEMFEHGADGPELMSVMKQINALAPDDLVVFKESLTNLAMEGLFNPGLGIGFAENVVDTVMSMVGRAA